MKRGILLFSLIMVVICLSACSTWKKGWNVEDYESIEDIISIEKIQIEEFEKISTYKVKYKSDECEVFAFLSIPNEFLENKEPAPCVIFNRGGNRNSGAIHPKDVASSAFYLNKIVFASQYRGAGGSTGEDEFGGDDLHDVLKLIDLCEQLPFVDMDNLYMMGISRGGMMTYMAIREDLRIKKAVVVSGVTDTFMSWEERVDMRNEVYMELIGKTPEEAPEGYEKRSAVYWADEIKCPVLIIHSKNDRRVSYAQAEKMVQKLEEAGKEYKFVSYDDDVHGTHQEDLDIILDWFN